jgi:hypothetical protein
MGKQLAAIEAEHQQVRHACTSNAFLESDKQGDARTHCVQLFAGRLPDRENLSKATARYLQALHTAARAESWTEGSPVGGTSLYCRG